MSGSASAKSVNRRLLRAKKNDFIGYPRYYSFHDRLSTFFDLLAFAIFLMLYVLAAITYVASILASAIRFLQQIFVVWIPMATGHIYRRVRRMGRRRGHLWLPGSAR